MDKRLIRLINMKLKTFSLRWIKLLSLFVLPIVVINQAFAQTPTTVQSNGKDSRADYILNAAMTNGSVNCGPSQIINNGWVIETEAYFNHNGLGVNTFINSTGGYFNASSGIFTAPLTGFYHVSFSMRVETGSGDVTLRKNGATRLAGLGTDLIERLGDFSNLDAFWSTHSTSKNVYLQTGDTLSLWHESGQFSDCTSDTNFKYNQFNVHLIRAVGGAG